MLKKAKLPLNLSSWLTTTLIFSNMPIEIKELHIKINVSDDQERSESSGSAATRSEKDKLIEACVEQVMELLSKKEER
jgi:hypothetical protein